MKNNTPPLTGVRAAVRSLDHTGTVAELARLLGVSRVAVLNWGNTIPLGRLTQVEQATGVRIEILRPDYIEEVKKLGVSADWLRPGLVRKPHRKARKTKPRRKTKATLSAE